MSCKCKQSNTLLTLAPISRELGAPHRISIRWWCKPANGFVRLWVCCLSHPAYLSKLRWGAITQCPRSKTVSLRFDFACGSRLIDTCIALNSFSPANAHRWSGRCMESSQLIQGASYFFLRLCSAIRPGITILIESNCNTLRY